MKKKNNKKIENSDFKPLSDELGIEPPKIYRSEQRQRINADYFNEKDKNSSQNISRKKSRDDVEKKPKHKRKLKSKYRKILYSLVLAIFIVIVLAVLSLTVLFKIETISVEGNERYETELITQNIPIAMETNLFLADTKNAEKMLETNLPYIHDVHIKRKIPSKLIVTVNEADTFYTAKDKDSTYILMDDNFKVLETNLEAAPEGVLLLDSVAIDNATVGSPLSFSDPNVQEALVKVNDEVKELRIAEITSIYATDGDHCYAVYDNRLVINLGNDSDLENKLYTALAIVEQLQKTKPQAEGEINVANGKQYYFTEKK